MFAGGIHSSTGARIGQEAGPWQASIVVHGDGSIVNDIGDEYVIGANLGACGTWHHGVKRFSIGWGACLWAAASRWVQAGSGPPVALEDDGAAPAAIVIRY
jgi:hypothetical protein